MPRCGNQYTLVRGTLAMESADQSMIIIRCIHIISAGSRHLLMIVSMRMFPRIGMSCRIRHSTRIANKGFTGRMQGQKCQKCCSSPFDSKVSRNALNTTERSCKSKIACSYVQHSLRRDFAKQIEAGGTTRFFTERRAAGKAYSDHELRYRLLRL